MRRYLALGLVLLWGCAAKDEDASAKKGAETSSGSGSGSASGADSGSASAEVIIDAATSANVSGAFLAALACDVVNASDTKATQTTFGCTVKDEKGMPVTEPIAAVGAKVAAKDVAAPVEASIAAQPAGSSYQFAFTANGVRPSAAQSLTFTAVYKGKQQEWVFLVPPAYLTKTTGDLGLFVDGAAGKDDGLCDQASPCKTIQRALSLVPEVIAHAVSINVLPTATYAEDVVVENKTVASGSLTVRGDGGKATIQGAMHAVSFVNVRGLTDQIRLEDLHITLPEPKGNADAYAFAAGVFVEDASLTVRRVDLEGPEGLEPKLHAQDLGEDAPRHALINAGGEGLQIETGGNVSISDVSFKSLAEAISIRQGNLQITGGVLIDTVFRAMIATDSSSISMLNDEVKSEFKFVVKNAVTGIILTGASSWQMYARRLTDFEVSGLRDVAQSFGVGIIVDGASSFANYYDANLTIKDLPTAIESDGQASIYWATTTKDIKLTGCTAYCLYSNGGNVNLGALNIAVGVTGDFGALVGEEEQAGIYLSYAASMSFSLPSTGSWTGPLGDGTVASMTDASIFEIMKLDPAAANPVYPSNGAFALARGSQFFRPTIGASGGVTTVPGGLCRAPTLGYDPMAQPLAGCVNVKE